MTSSDGNSGFMMILDSSVVPDTLSDHDAFSRCCVDTGLARYSVGDLCPLIYGRRPKNNSVEYIPPNSFTSFGDPHFITVDGNVFTFNPYGEFILLKSSDFELQARIINNLGPTHKASFITAVAAKDSSGSSVYLALNAEKNGETVLTAAIYMCKNIRCMYSNCSTILHIM